ncbi:protein MICRORCHIDIA 1-like [Diospyros lotus]|uniref:protein MICRORCHIDIA 1-like n=1 Tax=Diospyros lotus TaxID=55363 RepID=UPI0022533195|nr:protein MICRORCHIDIA 1-like [Diospyros lotus]
MFGGQGKESIDVVTIDSSDDEGGATVGKRNTSIPLEAPLVETKPLVRSTGTNHPSASSYAALESRSFWKAGNYSVGPTKSAALQGELEHARVHPKFLHSNATSHKWAFGAIAELLDNAVDEICNGATFVKVDRIYNLRDNSPALLFQDNGGGMDPGCLRKCMSLGYSSKKANTTIGQYGNGFKTSTMRLGADVIVLSRAARGGKETQSAGLLSYTFLRKTGQDDVMVPMVDFDISTHWAEPIIYSSQDDWSTNLKTILEWSPFASKDELMLQFEDIGSHGTKIIIYNLWLNDEGIFELNFDDDDEDIRLRDEANSGAMSRTNKRTRELQSHISYRIRYSLRAYASILYLRKFTNFQIILRGKPVEQFNIVDELKYQKKVVYKPQLGTVLMEVLVETTIGFLKEAPAIAVSGFNVYHKNRLIRPFWKVTSDGSSKGNGVVGVLEANFIEPAHDKQDFERSSLFIRLEMRMKQMVADYWKGHCHFIGFKPYDPNLRNMQKEHPVQHPARHMANVQKQLLNVNHISGLSRTSTHDGLPAARPTGHATVSVQEPASVNCSRSTLIDQICEENIHLFMRCEEQIQKEKELKETVETLEKQLERTKRKCARLSAHLESRRTQKEIRPKENF